MSQDALAGVRVLDLTRLLPGPYATQILVHYGADVIKVEDTGAGDYARDIRPLANSGYGAAFTAANRGKRSVALDLKSDEGLNAFGALVQEADVLVESFRPGVMGRFGLAAQELLARYPRLIYCAVSGYGQGTRRAHLAGHDLNFQAVAGLLWRDGGPPLMPTALIADLVGGSLSAVIAIQSALLERERSGRGRFIDLSIAHSALMLNPLIGALHLAQENTQQAQHRHGGGHPAYRLYETADGRHMAFGALEPKFWDRFCELAGCPEYAGKVGTHDRQELDRISARIDGIFKSRGFDEWVRLSLQWDVCVTPVLTPAEAVDEGAREGLPLFASFAGKRSEVKVLTGAPADLAHQGPRHWASPPAHGQHEAAAWLSD